MDPPRVRRIPHSAGARTEDTHRLRRALGRPDAMGVPTGVSQQAWVSSQPLAFNLSDVEASGARSDFHRRFSTVVVPDDAIATVGQRQRPRRRQKRRAVWLPHLRRRARDRPLQAEDLQRRLRLPPPRGGSAAPDANRAGPPKPESLRARRATMGSGERGRRACRPTRWRPRQPSGASKGV